MKLKNVYCPTCTKRVKFYERITGEYCCFNCRTFFTINKIKQLEN